jgi:glutamyl-tRNA synthetase/glutamyl-Q tRNA(Asp) synthetase
MDIHSLKSRLSRRPVTRFAPSPTGYLHLGHVASAIFVWGIGRALGAEIILRIEDHDRSRCRKDYERAILNDLRWLGFAADRGVTDADEPSEFRQSDCDSRYVAALKGLSTATSVYACECSRREIAEEGVVNSGKEPRYGGRCRDKGLPLGDGIGWRAVLPDVPIRFEDAFMGDIEQNPVRQCGDVLIRDRHGQWTYQFAVVADDISHGIDLIIRGEDLLASTGRQIALTKALNGGRQPLFAHHPLLVDGDGMKLGKRFLSEGIIKRRVACEDPRAVIGEAAFLCGLIETPRSLCVDDLPGLFGA